MGRGAISDAEKLANGTFYRRSSEDARALRVVEKIRLHPALNDVPEPKFPLRSPSARKEYDTWARRLHETGLLTTETHAWVSIYATSSEAIEITVAAGKAPSGAHLKAYTDALTKLQKLNVPLSLTPVAKKESRFAVNGFPGRVR